MAVVKTQPRTDLLNLMELLDTGQISKAVELQSGLPPSDDPLWHMLEAELEIYYGRLTEANEILNRITSAGFTTEEKARLMLIRGELAYWKSEYETADLSFWVAEALAQSDFTRAKCLYNVGRLKRRMGEFQRAENFLTEAQQLIEHLPEGLYLSGLIRFNLAVCQDQLGALEQAEALFKLAIEILGAVENGRYFGLALRSYGGLLMRLGDYEKSLSVLNQSRSILEGIGGFDDLAGLMNNIGLTLIRLQRFDQAEQLLNESLELYERTRNMIKVSLSFGTFAELYLEKGDLPKAEAHAKRAIDDADLAQHKFEKAWAMILLGRVYLREEDPSAAEPILRQAAEIGREINSKLIRATANVYRAECLIHTNTVLVGEILEETKLLLRDYYDAALLSEFQRVQASLDAQRIRFMENGALVIQPDLLPTWREAKHTLERWLITNAMKQANGNQPAAAKILGITKQHVNRLVKNQVNRKK